jgi:hypothetical protein
VKLLTWNLREMEDSMRERLAPDSLFLRKVGWTET